MRKFLVSRSFPLISERCLHSGGGRLFAGAWYGGVETCPYVAGTRFGSWRSWGRILFFADTTGHIRTLGSRLCGSGGWVRKFLVSRSFPLISERCIHSGGGRLFAGAWYGGVETCPYVAGTRLGCWRPRGRILFFCGHNRTFPGAGFPPVREWRLGAEISCVPLISAHFRALSPFRWGRLFAET